MGRSAASGVRTRGGRWGPDGARNAGCPPSNDLPPPPPPPATGPKGPSAERHCTAAAPSRGSHPPPHSFRHTVTRMFFPRGKGGTPRVWTPPHNFCRPEALGGGGALDGGGGGHPLCDPPPPKGVQPMPRHCPRDAKCQLQWRL